MNEQSAETRLVVLISGRGSNLAALAEACDDGRLPAVVAAAISNRADAPGLLKAEALGIDRVLITEGESPDRQSRREEFERSLQAAIEGYRPRYIVLAGFMRVLSAELVNAWPGRMINIHPSLLPRFRGLDTHRRALEAGDHEHGASVHFVTPALDGGPVISQVRMALRPGDDPDQVARRLLPLEHRLLVATLALLLDHRVEVRDDCIQIDDQPLQAPLLLDHDLPDPCPACSGAG